MSNATTFLNSFAAIEKYLRARSDADRHASFYQLVDRASSVLPAVRRHRDDLKEYADLRNAIVHERSDGRPIAEPNDRAVRELQQLESFLLNPPRVLPAFQKHVYTVDASAQITDALAFFSPRNFSQVPVTKSQRVVALLTTNTVSRWLASHVDDGIVSLTDYTVADALKYTEYDDNWRVARRDTTLAEAVTWFDKHEAEGKRLDALLITQSGRPAEALLGIITIHDMPKVLRRLSLRGERTGAA